MPAISGDAAAITNLENENTPRVLAATLCPTTSRAAAVRMGWSLKKNMPIKARMITSPTPSPKGTNNAVRIQRLNIPGINTNFLPKRSEMYPIAGVATTPTPTNNAMCSPKAAFPRPSSSSSPRYKARKGRNATLAMPRRPATAIIPHNLGCSENDCRVFAICSLNPEVCLS